MKNIVVKVLKDFVVSLSTWIAIGLGYITLLIAASASWFEIWIWIPALTFSWLVFRPLLKHWESFFDKVFKNERDPTQS